MRLADRGEFGIIAGLRARCPGAPGLLTGIGDDCAVVALPPGEELLVTSDMLVEGIHFRRDWIDPLRLGRKCAAVNLSDLAAMGGVPRYLFLALALPPDLDTDALDAFCDGFLAACAEQGAVLAGGDTCASASGMTVSVTALGSAPAGSAVRRAGGCPGDDLYVSGTLGDSALALRQLLAGAVPEPYLQQRHFDPQPRVALGRALAAGRLATAMIDLSDGLLADLGHLLAASGTGALVDVASLPLSAPLRRALTDDPDVADLPLIGGEDYELLFTAPPAAAAAVTAAASAAATPVRRIGKLLAADAGLQLEDAGHPRPLPAQRGYKHFAAGAE